MSNKIKYGGAVRRLLSFVIDFLICFVVATMLRSLYVMITQGFDALSTNTWSLMYLSAWSGKLSQFIFPAYFIYFEQSKHQATFGKMLFGLKVVDDHGKALTLWKAVVRTFWFMFVGIIQIILLKYYYSEEVKMGHTMTTQEFIVYMLSSVLSIAWVAPILFTKERTGVYEMLSKTRVVRR